MTAKKITKKHFNNGRIHVMVGPLFWELLKCNGGIFPDDDDDMIINSFAAWYFAKNAHLSIHVMKDEVVLEGEKDPSWKLRQVMRSSLTAYGIDPDDGDKVQRVMNLMPLCRQEAFRRNRVWLDRFQAWLDSAGRAYNEVTREPPSD